MSTGCKDCDRSFLIDNDDLCPKHKLEYLKWVAKTAQEAYMEALRVQSRKKEKK